MDQITRREASYKTEDRQQQRQNTHLDNNLTTDVQDGEICAKFRREKQESNRTLKSKMVGNGLRGCALHDSTPQSTCSQTEQYRKGKGVRTAETHTL